MRDVHAWRARMTGTNVSFEVPGAGVVRHRSATEDREIAKVEGGAVAGRAEERATAAATRGRRRRTARGRGSRCRTGASYERGEADMTEAAPEQEHGMNV